MKKTLLTPPCGNTKTNKSLALGYANYILHRAPAIQAAAMFARDLAKAVAPYV